MDNVTFHFIGMLYKNILLALHLHVICIMYFWFGLVVLRRGRYWSFFFCEATIFLFRHQSEEEKILNVNKE